MTNPNGLVGQVDLIGLKVGRVPRNFTSSFFLLSKGGEKWDSVR